MSDLQERILESLKIIPNKDIIKVLTDDVIQFSKLDIFPEGMDVNAYAGLNCLQLSYNFPTGSLCMIFHGDGSVVGNIEHNDDTMEIDIHGFEQKYFDQIKDILYKLYEVKDDRVELFSKKSFKPEEITKDKSFLKTYKEHRTALKALSNL